MRGQNLTTLVSRVEKEMKNSTFFVRSALAKTLNRPSVAKPAVQPSLSKTRTDFVKMAKRNFSVQVTKATDSTNLVTPPEGQSHATKNLSTYDDMASRNFTYFMVGTYSFVGAVAAKNIITDYLEHFSASADVLALAKVEVDMNAIPAGKNIIIKWRGKPIFVRHRTMEGI